MAGDLAVTGEVLSGEIVSPGGAPPIPVRGRAPAQKLWELKDLMRQAGLGDLALAAVDAWLASERRSSAATRKGYVTDVSWWFFWLAMQGLNPADVAPMEADRYAAALQEAKLEPATRSRRFSSVRSLYRYLLRNEAVRRNPFEGMDMPQVPTTSKTRGLSKAQLDQMLAWAKKEAVARIVAYEEGRGKVSRARDGARTYAMLCLLVVTAARVGGVIQVELDALGYDEGHRVIDLPVKGPRGKTLRFPVPPYALAAIENYLTYRGHEPGPLFQTDSGRPVAQQAMFGTVQRIAKLADVPHWDQISVHSIRHAIATHALRSGMPLHKVQELLGHASPATTIRYLRRIGVLDESLAYQLGMDFAVGEAQVLAPDEDDDDL